MQRLFLFLPVMFAVAAHARAEELEHNITVTEAAEPIQLCYGTHTLGATITPSVDYDRFDVHCKAGDSVRIRVQGQTWNFDPRIQVIGPDGLIIKDTFASAPSWGPVSLGIDLDPFTLTGTYTFFVSDQGNNDAGNYSLEIVRLPANLPHPGIPYNSIASGVISPATDTDDYQFVGSSNSTILIAVQGHDWDLDPHVEVLAPDGTLIASQLCAAPSWGPCSFQFMLPLTQSGLHHLLISDSGADNVGSYDIGLTCFIGNCANSPAGLRAAPPSLSVTNGGTQTLDLDAGTANAHATYWTMASISGFCPGTPLSPSRTIPLNYDTLMLATIRYPGAILVNGFGTLDSMGKVSASLVLTPPLDPGLVGLVLYHSAIAFPSWPDSPSDITFISNPVSTIFVP